MLRYAADENFNNHIIRGLARRLPELDLVRVQDAGLIGADDEAVLDWAAASGRVLLTHDVTTITRWAYQRIAEAEAMPGVFVASRSLPVGQVIEDLILLAEGSVPDEWAGQILYLPLK